MVNERTNKCEQYGRFLKVLTLLQRFILSLSPENAQSLRLEDDVVVSVLGVVAVNGE